MKKEVKVCAGILAALLLCSNQLLFGQTSGLIQKKTTPATYVDTKLYEYYNGMSGYPPRLLFPYNPSTFSSTDFLLDLKVDGTNNTKGLRLSSPLFSFEVLNVGSSYGLYQTGSNYVNYFGSKTAIGGTAAFQPAASLHVSGNGIFSGKLGIGSDNVPATTLQVVGNGVFTDKLGIGLDTAPLTQLQIGSGDSIVVRFDPKRMKSVNFVNSAEASCFKFWALRDITNPIEKGEGEPIGEIPGYSSNLAFVINPTGEIISKYAVVHNTITTAIVGASKLIAAPRMVTDTFQLRTNADEGKILISDRAGYGNWTDAATLFPQYWINNGIGGIYTDKLKVGINTSNTFDYTLAVNGVIGCKEIKVEVSSPWPDYVFSPQYNLPALSEVERFVTTNGRLPDVPSAKEVASEGIAVGEMQATLLKKVEELTLYMIQQQKTIEQQQNQINELKALLQNK
ncbi:MAG: hypothetical protein PHQ65_16650 [Bacteroidales bacterium]|nr:hypothetical protein [Bacteroidales bacterium]MDD3666898.1 hypothetical protein [Bacteroidales bacterium]